jgi:hypothetical protein
MAHKVIAHLPGTVELSRRTTKDTLTVWIEEDGETLGNLVIAHGTIEWWPKGKKKKARRASWGKFAQVCEEHISQRKSVRRSKKPVK